MTGRLVRLCVAGQLSSAIVPSIQNLFLSPKLEVGCRQHQKSLAAAPRRVALAAAAARAPYSALAACRSRRTSRTSLLVSTGGAPAGMHESMQQHLNVDVSYACCMHACTPRFLMHCALQRVQVHDDCNRAGSLSVTRVCRAGASGGPSGGRSRGAIVANPSKAHRERARRERLNDG